VATGDAYLEALDPLDERQFSIAVRRLADSLSYGTDSSPFRGSGIEYVQSRPYEPGDPVKAIDWRVTARAGKVYVKEYEAPKRMPVYLVIDTSASMTIGSLKLTKYAWALQVAGGIALACLDRVSPVGVLGVGVRDFKIQPSLSRDRVLQWLHQLRHFRYDEGTTLGRRLLELTPTLADRVLFIVLSDLYDPGALPALRLVAQRHDCMVLQFQDPAERGMRGSGFFQAREVETGRKFVTHGRSRWSDREGLDGEFRRAGIDFLRIPIDRPFQHHLRGFLNDRGTLGRGAR